jgi:hypothetical protein
LKNFGRAHPSKPQETGENPSFGFFLGGPAPKKLWETVEKSFIAGKPQKNPYFKTCSLCLTRNFPAGEPSHLPLVSPHICHQIRNTTHGITKAEGLAMKQHITAQRNTVGHKKGFQ